MSEDWRRTEEQEGWSLHFVTKIVIKLHATPRSVFGVYRVFLGSFCMHRESHARFIEY